MLLEIAKVRIHDLELFISTQRSAGFWGCDGKSLGRAFAGDPVSPYRSK